MSRIHKLEFCHVRLSEEAKAKLRQGWCIDEDPNHLWLSKNAWMDTTHDSLYNTEGPEAAEQVDLDIQFALFVESLGLPEDDQTLLLRRWDSNPDLEVEWC